MDLARAVGAHAVALALSPTGAGDGYDKILRYMDIFLRVRSQGLRVIAWNQGVLGSLLVAAGVDGYETGIGQGESTDVSRRLRSRHRRSQPKQDFGRYRGVYLEPLGSSVPHAIAELAFRDRQLLPEIMCGEDTCCASPTDTLENYRQHAVRSRARKLQQLREQPHPRWRLMQVVHDAEHAVTVARHVNEGLQAAGANYSVRTVHLEAIGQVAQHVSEMLRAKSA